MVGNDADGAADDSEVDVSDDADPTGWAGDNSTMSRLPAHGEETEAAEETEADEDWLEGAAEEEEGVDEFEEECWWREDEDDPTAYAPFTEGA
ncbi:unnamed protein product [Closterium sp. Naga37s-1]|nr:unnamed protein product [Closterium sp. Naga37s-1]